MPDSTVQIIAERVSLILIVLSVTPLETLSSLNNLT